MAILDAIKKILGFAPAPTGALNSRATHTPSIVKDVVKWVNPLAGIEITDEYKKANALMDAGVPLLFVTGKAGTGKSTFIEFLRHKLSKQSVVLAPTGVAALNVRGVTVHSFFGFPPRVLSKEDIRPVQDRKLYKSLDVLILDEVSMIRVDVLDAIDEFLRLNGKNPGQPFGGTQVVMVGDLFQLPPVVPPPVAKVLTARKYTSPFFFSSTALTDQVIAPVELVRVFRQQDPEFIRVLDRIRLGDGSEELLRVVNDRVGAPSREDSVIVLTPTNAGADTINISQMDRLPGECQEYVGVITGKLNLEEDSLPSPLHLRLKVNARVMFTKNDQQHRWVNGSLGTVTNLKPGVISVRIDDHGCGVVDVDRASWEKYKYIYDEREDKICPVVVASYSQVPLMLAWAITIHKSQGKTLAALRIDLGWGAFAPGQTYVALSRARRLQDIWLSRPIRRADIFCDPRILQFDAELFNRPVEAGSKPDMTPDTGQREPQSEPPTIPPKSETPICQAVGKAINADSIRDLIETAMASGGSVTIAYTDFKGDTTTRTIGPTVWVNGDQFTAFCELRNAERNFLVSRINKCVPLERFTHVLRTAPRAGTSR